MEETLDEKEARLQIIIKDMITTDNRFLRWLKIQQATTLNAQIRALRSKT